MPESAITDAAADFKEVVLDIVEKGHDVKVFAHDVEVSVKKSAPWIRRLVALLFSCMSQKAVSAEPVVQTSKEVAPLGDEPPALEPSPDASVSTDQKEAASN